MINDFTIVYLISLMNNLDYSGTIIFKKTDYNKEVNIIVIYDKKEM